MALGVEGSPRPDGVWLLYVEPGGQPVELSPGKAARFRLIPRPTIPPRSRQTLVQQDEPGRFPEQELDPVTAFATEQVQGTSVWIHMEGVTDDRTQAINRFAHVCIRSHDIDRINCRDIA